MYDLAVALGLVMVIEGALYALFPNGMRRTMVILLKQSTNVVRGAGLCLALAGFIVVLLLKKY